MKRSIAKTAQARKITNKREAPKTASGLQHAKRAPKRTAKARAKRPSELRRALASADKQVHAAQRAVDAIAPPPVPPPPFLNDADKLQMLVKGMHAAMAEAADEVRAAQDAASTLVGSVFDRAVALRDFAERMRDALSAT